MHPRHRFVRRPAPTTSPTRLSGDVGLRRAGADTVVVTTAVVALGRIVMGPLRGFQQEDVVGAWLQARRTPALDRVTWALSTYSDTVPTIVVATYLLVSRHRRGVAMREAALPVAAITLETAVFMSAAACVGRARPELEHLDRPAPTSSFPSGHTGATTALHRTLADMAADAGAPRIAVAVLRWVWPPLVGWSRLYRGMHHPSDVIAGMAVGAWSHRTVRRLAVSGPAASVADSGRRGEQHHRRPVVQNGHGHPYRDVCPPRRAR